MVICSPVLDIEEPRLLMACACASKPVCTSAMQVASFHGTIAHAVLFITKFVCLSWTAFGMNRQKLQKETGFPDSNLFGVMIASKDRFLIRDRHLLYRTTSNITYSWLRNTRIMPLLSGNEQYQLHLAIIAEDCVLP